MRIISINAHYQDKLGYQDYFLGKALKDMGHDVQFVTSDVHFDYPDYDNTVKHIIGDKYVGTGIFLNDYGVKVHRLKSADRSRTKLIWLKGFKAKILELKPDLIISHGVFTYQSLRLLYMAKELDCRIVFDDHTTINLVRKTLYSKFIYFLFRSFFAKRFLKVSDKIVGISETCMDVLRDNFGLFGHKTRMIPLGTDTDIYYPKKKIRLTFRKSINVKDDEILVVYTGKIYNLKNAHLIIDALNDTNVRGNRKIKILYVGDIVDEYKDFFYKKIQQSENEIILRNSVEIGYLADVYNGADLCVWPDHLTTSTIDASACGCPIICSDYMPERVKYNNGLLVKHGNLLDLKDKLNMLISNDQLRVEMGLKGIEYVNAELSWRVVAETFISEL